MGRRRLRSPGPRRSCRTRARGFPLTGSPPRSRRPRSSGRNTRWKGPGPARRREIESELAEIHPACFGWALACCGWNRQEAEEVLQSADLEAIDGRRRSACRPARIGLAGRPVVRGESAGNNLVFPLDVSGSMAPSNKLPLLRSIERDAADGIFVTTLGFGYGNYQDDRLEQLADRGNGNHAYIDSPREVAAYRLIGYENRMLKKGDFTDDRKDAGEIGAGHTVTALYEIVPAGGRTNEAPPVDELCYQVPSEPSAAAASGELLTVKLRYEQPDGDGSDLLTFPVTDPGDDLDAASADFRFAAAVAEVLELAKRAAELDAKRTGEEATD